LKTKLVLDFKIDIDIYKKFFQFKTSEHSENCVSFYSKIKIYFEIVHARTNFQFKTSEGSKQLYGFRFGKIFTLNYENFYSFFFFFFFFFKKFFKFFFKKKKKKKFFLF
jgi:hypothetical protein